MKTFFKKHKTLLLILLVGFLSLLAVLPLIQKGFFISDDGEWMVIRFSAFYQTLRDGQFPPRFFGRLNHGYGYPIGVFLYPAFMYLATPFKILGLGFADAIKTVIISSFLFSGIGSYVWLRLRFSVLAAVIGALVYVYFPYHIYDLYVRGSVGELVGFAVLPFLLLAIEKKQLIPGSFLYGLLILSHNTFAFLLTPFLLFYTYYRSRQLLFLYTLGLLVSAFFWLPSIMELSLTVFNKTAISDWKNYFLNSDNFYSVGISGVIFMFIALLAVVKGKFTERFYGVTFLIALFLASSFSEVLWGIGVLPKLVQFPWRFLILAVWTGSFLSAYMLEIIPRGKRVVGASCVVVIICLSSLPIFQEYTSVVRDDGFYATNEDTTTTHGEYMPVWVKRIPSEHPTHPVVVTKGRGEMKDVFQAANRTQFRFTSPENASLTINKIYYPGMQLLINGEQHHPGISKEGYVSVNLPKGEHTVVLSFGETLTRLVIDSISLATGVILFVLLIMRSMRLVPWYNKHSKGKK